MKTGNAVVSPSRPVLVRRTPSRRSVLAPYTPLDFADINQKARCFADLIEQHMDELADVLLEYESYEVVQDEVARTLDLLRNLTENEKYFRLRVNEITTFLPRNQPLYAFTCFAVVPSFMAREVHFRIPHSMHHFFPRMLSLLRVDTAFPNLIVSNQTRLEFLRERSALRVNPITEETVPVTDVVIFTGTSAHADQLRLIFDNRTLFIANGSGHNPVIVSDDAAVGDAVDAVLTLNLYNQGQDCAAPNAILVHKAVSQTFLNLLHDRLRTVKVGHYRDKSCRVGPNSDPKDLVRIQELLIHHRAWLDPATPGVIRTRDAIIEPTIICKPLKEGGNFTELFAPIIFVQEYEQDADLARYFEDSLYAQNAMYISVYGTSPYVERLVGRPFEGKVLHDEASVLHGMNPHDHGVERGTQPYGGRGREASSLSIGGDITHRPTLPQRDIYELVAKPLLRHKSLETYRESLQQFTKIEQKNVEKLLRLAPQETSGHKEVSVAYATYIDTRAIEKPKGRRYVKMDEQHTYRLLESPNVEYIATLKRADLTQIRAVRSVLFKRTPPPVDALKTLLYALVKKPGMTEREHRAHQHAFFGHLYRLLLGEGSGPRLPQFLLDVDKAKVRALLDV